MILKNSVPMSHDGFDLIAKSQSPGTFDVESDSHSGIGGWNIETGIQF